MASRQTTLISAAAFGTAALLAGTVWSGVQGAHARAQAFDPTPARQGPCALDAISWSDPDRISLPGSLSEVSGLAVLDSTRLVAHDDERGVVTLIDSGSGERVGRFTLGPRLPRDDFEGIAVLDGRLYLATSEGRLYESPIGADGQTVEFRVHETGLGRQCEMEGLAVDPDSRSLLLSCKDPRASELRDQVVIWAWSLDRAVLEGHRFRAPVAAIAAEKGKRFRPSAIERLSGGDLLIVSGADRAIAVVAPPDTVRCTRRLHSRHRQAEGVTRLPDGTLVISDEGSPARLTIYHPISR